MSEGRTHVRHYEEMETGVLDQWAARYRAPPPAPSPPRRHDPLIGHAWARTGDQELAPQLDALYAAGCQELFEQHASWASRARPQFAAALAPVVRATR